MAGAGKKRAKAERNDRGTHTGGESSRTGDQYSTTDPSSMAEFPRFDGPPPLMGSTASGPTDESRGRRLSNVPSHPGSRAGSPARAGGMVRAASTIRSVMGDPSRRPQPLQLNKNVDYPAGVYSMYSQVSVACVCSRRASIFLDCPFPFTSLRRSLPCTSLIIFADFAAWMPYLLRELLVPIVSMSSDVCSLYSQRWEIGPFPL